MWLLKFIHAPWELRWAKSETCCAGAPHAWQSGVIRFYLKGFHPFKAALKGCPFHVCKMKEAGYYHLPLLFDIKREFSRVSSPLDQSSHCFPTAHNPAPSIVTLASAASIVLFRALPPPGSLPPPAAAGRRNLWQGCRGQSPLHAEGFEVTKAQLCCFQGRAFRGLILLHHQPFRAALNGGIYDGGNILAA